MPPLPALDLLRSGPAGPSPYAPKSRAARGRFRLLTLGPATIVRPAGGRPKAERERRKMRDERPPPVALLAEPRHSRARTACKQMDPPPDFWLGQRNIALYPGAVWRVCARADAQVGPPRQRKCLAQQGIKNLKTFRICPAGGGAVVRANPPGPGFPQAGKAGKGCKRGVAPLDRKTAGGLPPRGSRVGRVGPFAATPATPSRWPIPSPRRTAQSPPWSSTRSARYAGPGTLRA